MLGGGAGETKAGDLQLQGHLQVREGVETLGKGEFGVRRQEAGIIGS